MDQIRGLRRHLSLCLCLSHCRSLISSGRPHKHASPSQRLLLAKKTPNSRSTSVWSFVTFTKSKKYSSSILRKMTNRPRVDSYVSRVNPYLRASGFMKFHEITRQVFLADTKKYSYEWLVVLTVTEYPLHTNLCITSRNTSTIQHVRDKSQPARGDVSTDRPATNRHLKKDREKRTLRFHQERNKKEDPLPKIGEPHRAHY